MSLEAWLIFLAAETLLCLAPGPAVLMVVSTGLARGAEASVYASLGILGANAIYFALSSAGVGALILASHEVFYAVRWIGVAYLVWLGLRTILGAHGGLSLAGGPRPGRERGRLFRTGLVMKLADPKTLFYFVALLPQFIDPRGDVGLQVAILAITSVVVEFGVLAGYGVLAGRLHGYASRPAFARWTDRLSGTFLIGAGVGMAFVRRGD